MSTITIKRPKRTRRVTLIALSLLVILAVIFTYIWLNKAGDALTGLTPPADFEPMAEIDLSAQAYSEETLAQFALDDTSDVGVFFTIPEIDTSYFDLSLKDADGNSLTILHSEALRTDRDGGGLWEQTLPPGGYRLVLSAAQSPGVLSVYWNDGLQ